MKICPVCKARCFDDMDVCFGCMHRFDDDEETGQGEPTGPGVPSSEDGNANADLVCEVGGFEVKIRVAPLGSAVT
ncbi:hypothetical protein [Curtanaerobium respiraculi]|uniref:hypothetical protein n=1 Tax=Curtanaerobium respiraculi TaxID=2949669 RepID=UPI0024B3A4C4|nr:hypothetical protein [Curtanaerobium respiraculi]